MKKYNLHDPSTIFAFMNASKLKWTREDSQALVWPEYKYVNKWYSLLYRTAAKTWTLVQLGYRDSHNVVISYSPYEGKNSVVDVYVYRVGENAAFTTVAHEVWSVANGKELYERAHFSGRHLADQYRSKN